MVLWLKRVFCSDKRGSASISTNHFVQVIKGKHVDVWFKGSYWWFCTLTSCMLSLWCACVDVRLTVRCVPASHALQCKLTYMQADIRHSAIYSMTTALLYRCCWQIENVEAPCLKAAASQFTLSSPKSKGQWKKRSVASGHLQRGQKC